MAKFGSSIAGGKVPSKLKSPYEVAVMLHHFAGFHDGAIRGRRMAISL